MDSDAVVKACAEEMMDPVPEWYWKWFGQRTAKPVLNKLKIRYQTEKADNLVHAIESGQPVFTFSNHLSWADHFLIMFAVDDCAGAAISALCKERYYQYPVFGWILRVTNQIPITNVKLCFARWFKQHTGRAPRQSDFIEFINSSGEDPYHEANVLKRQGLARTASYTCDMIERDRIILGYPEGTRSQRSKIQPIKTGIIQLPFECKGIVVPTAIWGTDKIIPKGAKWHSIFKYFTSDGVQTNVRFGRGISYSEMLDACQEKFERIEDMVNLEKVKTLRALIEEDRFRAYTLEAEKFERIFDESSLLVMRSVNENLPEEYRTEQIEIKYPR